MSRVIRLDDDIWEYLKKQPVTLGEDHNDLLRRLLKVPMPRRVVSTPSQFPKGTGRGVLQADRDYANIPINGYEFQGKQYKAKTYKEVLIGVCENLRSRHANEFDEVALKLHGKKRNYFSRMDSGMMHPRQLSGNGVRGQQLHVESNMSATSIMGLCQHLIRKLADDVHSFKVY